METTTPTVDPLLQPPQKQKRSSVACRRCRRLRAKCVKEEGGQGLCRGCIDAGVPNECQFLPRGMSAIDRAPRPSQKRKRQRRDTSPEHDLDSFSSHTVDGVCTACHQQVSPQPLSPPENVEDLLPPQQELIDGCEWFFSTYFQLGFLHKPTFMHRLINTPTSISRFLLLSMLSISARFTPSLIQRYNAPANAASVFAKRAQELAGQEMLGNATLERAQGFFLCSIWSWGSGYRDRSWIFLGIAARMASILKLPEEENYNLRPQARVEDVIEAEVSRRTWWVIFMSDNLLSSGCGRPISFDLDKVTIPLPLDEDHFFFGQQGPTTVLPGTKAKPQPRALHIDPQLQKGSVNDVGVFGSGIGDRSLYGNLITIADIWARVARSAMQRTKDTVAAASPISTVPPWLSESDFCKFVRELQDWESTLGPRQSWSQSNLLAYQQKQLDMGFRGIFLIMHLAHIVLRRSYLPMLAHDVQKSQTHGSRTSPTSSNGRQEYSYHDVPAPPRFWENMVHDMFSHALKLIELVESWVPTRPFSKGCTPMMGFSLFMAGSVLCYLSRWKWLCPSLYPYTERAVQSALVMIADIAVLWPPMGTRWHSTLSKVATESCDTNDYDDYHNSYKQPSPRERGVEGLGRKAEEDLSTDDREGMYRHQSEDGSESNHSSRGEPPRRSPVNRTQTLQSVRQTEGGRASLNDNGNGMPQIPHPPPSHGAHMLYSLATAASTIDPKVVPNRSGILGGMQEAQIGVAAHPGAVMPGAHAVDWQHFQTDLNLLLSDDLGSHLEYGGDGWAF
ncbi:hypothetical protein E1B28_006518 [Marasmius oreades]|uniref:Zn(2)-C6 fungal-type domain-containing protein n=1 Tax=Marasmius oreades TaxID=181124 RepID=A0A9P7UW72_9AGAR|nr:uncharacterized protein E1B28_006518 [Marasmius oreades]KAG7095821.1 hypothetical protein E1B28_006518 [Marasmius oreades]